MIDYLQDWLEWFVTYLTSIWDFITNLFSSVFDFFRSVPILLTFLTSSIGHLPSVVLPFATAGIVLSVVMLLVGRSNNG